MHKMKKSLFDLDLTDEDLENIELKAKTKRTRDEKKEDISKRIDDISSIDSITPKNKVPKLITYFLLSLSFVTTVGYFAYTIINSKSLIEQFSTIVSTSLMMLFALFFVITGLFADNKKGRIFVILASILLTSYSGFNILYSTNIIKLPTQNSVKNFSGKTLVDVVKWAQANNIKIEQVYETSDTAEEYEIINQDVDPGTLTKEVDKIVVTVSSGPNLDKETVVPSMLGWEVDQVIDYVDENFLVNLVINFQYSEEEKDSIITQDKSGQLKRNDAITLTASLGMEGTLTPVNMENLVGLNTFKSTTWLKRNGLKYTINYEFSDKYEKGIVINQSVKEKTEVDPNSVDTNIIITISKGPEIKVPSLLTMSVEDITTWVVENSLKIEFAEAYDDTITTGGVLSASQLENDIVEQGTVIKIVVSKGQLKMEPFTTVGDLRSWATNNGITINETYEYSTSVASGNIISLSHKQGDIIKNTDSISVVVSKGSSVSIPNFVGMSKSSISSKCSSVGLRCSFSYGGFSNSVSKDISTSQSMRSGSVVSRGTSINITLSSGKANIYSIMIQDSWLSNGDAATTVSTLRSKLSAACPGVTFNIYTKTVNNGIGLITNDSPVKAGYNTFTQGNSYTIYVGK